MKTTIINKCIQEAVQKVKGKAKKKLQEPDYTAALTIELPPILNAHKVKGIKVGGCFIHQSPRAIFNKTLGLGCCELGDMLVLIRTKSIGGNRHYNAALLQMKRVQQCSSTPPLVIKDSGDLTQLQLYESWPSFTIKSINKTKYDIFPKVPNQGALYCIIEEKSNHGVQFYMANPAQTMVYSNQLTLGRFIHDMMVGHAGRAISDAASRTNDEWSKLIWDLLQYTAHRLFNRKNSGFTKTKSGVICMMTKDMKESSTDVEVFLQFMMDFSRSNDNFEESEHDAEKGNSHQIDDPNNDNLGISTLFIDIDEEGFEKEEQDRI